MEQRRMMPALSVGLLLVMVWFMVGIPMLYRVGPPEKPQEPPPPTPTETPVKPPVPPPEAAVLPEEPPAVESARFGNLDLRFDNRGARVTQAIVVDSNIDLVPPPAAGDAVPPGLFVLRGPGAPERRGWKLVSKGPDELVYETGGEGGLRLRKRFAPGPSADRLRVTLELVNPGAQAVTFDGALELFPGIEHDGAYRYAMYHHALVAEGPLGRPGEPEKYIYWSQKEEGKLVGRLERYRMMVPNADVGPRVQTKGEATAYAALLNRYFAAAGWAAGPEDQKHWKDVYLQATPRMSRNGSGRAPEERSNIALEVDLHPIVVGPGETVAVATEAYLGPLKAERLPATALGNPEYVIDFRGFNWLGSALLWLMSLFQNVNWGLGIIVMTIIVRFAVAPLSIKSQASMARFAKVMQRMKPKMEALQKRYKDDPRRLQEETMALYRAEGTNPMAPMGGCWPMFVQLPVFISMYAVLDVAVELRQQPFIGWIADLSQPDRLVSFDSPIPLLLFSIDAINLLPVVMAATWAVQMYMTPAPATDPQQVQTQKMMRWMMPTLFFFFCYDLASGLSLYFFVNSLLGILESKLVRTFILKPEEAAPEAAAAAGAKSNR